MVRCWCNVVRARGDNMNKGYKRISSKDVGNPTGEMRPVTTNNPKWLDILIGLLIVGSVLYALSMLASAATY